MAVRRQMFKLASDGKKKRAGRLAEFTDGTNTESMRSSAWGKVTAKGRQDQDNGRAGK